MSTVNLNHFAGRDFARFVKALARTRGDAMGAVPYAEGQGWTPAALALKALVTPVGEGTDPALVPILNDLAALLRPLTIVGRLQGMRRVPFSTRLLRQDVGGAGDWVGEGQPIPVTAAGFSQVDTLDIRRVAGIRVLTEDFLRNAVGASEPTVAADAAGAVVEALDLAFIDPANTGSTIKPASITAGATEVSSTGSAVANIDTDLEDLLGVLIAAEMPLTSASWIMSPITATHLALKRGTSGAPAYPGVTARGGTLLGLPVLTSSNVAASGSPGERFIALVEASEINLADDGDGAIELSSRAALQMNDAPGTGAAQLVSLWQNGLVGIKAQRFINWKRRRSGAVAVLRNVTY
jgi:HK97 family phage major capsid protein